MRAVALAFLAGCGVADPDGGPQRVVLADAVLDAPGHTGQGYRDSALAVNGVRGGGLLRGSTDVFSLGLEAGVDDTLVLGFSEGPIVDGPGPDLAVFENPFEIRGGAGRFMDPVVVEVSPDGVAWVAFAHAFLSPTPGLWSEDPLHWEGFAGITPVLLHDDDNPVDPFSDEAGGDRFDLADLPAGDAVADEVLARGAVAVRLSSAPMWIDPATQEPFVVGPGANGADIDGVYARVHASSP